MVFKKFKEDIVEPYAKSKIVITFYSLYLNKFSQILEGVSDQLSSQESERIHAK